MVSHYLVFEFVWEGVGWGGRLLTFSAFRMGSYSRWALIRGWALIRINMVYYRKQWLVALGQSLRLMKVGEVYLLSPIFVCMCEF